MPDRLDALQCRVNELEAEVEEHVEKFERLLAALGYKADEHGDYRFISNGPLLCDSTLYEAMHRWRCRRPKGHPGKHCDERGDSKHEWQDEEQER
jgi:hypothetical protein